MLQDLWRVVVNFPDTANSVTIANLSLSALAYIIVSLFSTCMFPGWVELL